VRPGCHAEEVRPGSGVPSGRGVDLLAHIVHQMREQLAAGDERGQGYMSQAGKEQAPGAGTPHAPLTRGKAPRTVERGQSREEQSDVLSSLPTIPLGCT
jgi:hypothetical protein